MSDRYEYKELNPLLEELHNKHTLKEISTALTEMHGLGAHPGSNSLVVLEGDFKYLGSSFFVLPGIGKNYHFDIEAVKTGDDLQTADLSNTVIRGRITQTGRKELEEYELKQSVSDTNKSVRITNRMTLWIAGLALALSIMNLVQSLYKSDKISVPEL